MSKRHPSSMSRLKNLLIAEGVSETSARRKIADLDTEAGCMVIEEYGSLKLNQKLLSQMFLQIQSEIKIPNHFEEEYKTQVAALERKIEKLEKGNTDEFNALRLENEKKNGVIETLKNDAEKKKEAKERQKRYAELERKWEEDRKQKREEKGKK